MEEDKTELDDDLAALDELSQLLEQAEGKQEPDAGGSDAGTASPKEDSQTFSRAFDVCPARLLPPDHIACKHCPFAKWFGNKEILKCWCREMFQIVYQSDNPEEHAYTYCDRKIDEA